jgi:hypothetical protein
MQLQQVHFVRRPSPPVYFEDYDVVDSMSGVAEASARRRFDFVFLSFAMNDAATSAPFVRELRSALGQESREGVAAAPLIPIGIVYSGDVVNDFLERQCGVPAAVVVRCFDTAISWQVRNEVSRLYEPRIQPLPLQAPIPGEATHPVAAAVPRIRSRYVDDGNDVEGASAQLQPTSTQAHAPLGSHSHQQTIGFVLPVSLLIAMWVRVVNLRSPPAYDTAVI